MTLQVLLSAMFLQDENYIDSLNICSDCVVINQCDASSSRKIIHRGIDGQNHNVTYIESTARGLSKSRNLAISNAEADVCILCDNDVEYVEGYEKLILDQFEANPDADIIVFYIKRPEKPEPNYPDIRRMDYMSVLKIFSPEIAFRKDSISDIRFNEMFGAGAKYYMGEENIFLYDCLKAGKKIIYAPIMIAKLRDEESTWFKGFDRNFFIARGANYGAMSKWFSHVLIWQFALRKRALYGDNLTTLEALKTMYKGRKLYLKSLNE